MTKNQKKKLRVLGERVQSLRNSRKLTLKALAHSVGKDPQSIHRLEKGNVNPSYLYLLQICEGLDIGIAELLKNLPD